MNKDANPVTDNIAPGIRHIPIAQPPITITPSFRFFGVKIQNHPENPIEKEAPNGVIQVHHQTPHEEDDENDDALLIESFPRFEQPTEVIFKKGRVVGLAVDKDLLEIIQEKETERHLCHFCRDGSFEVSLELRSDLRKQGGFIFKILMIENCLHLCPLGLMALQYFVRPFHDFMYEQWVVIFLFMTILYITLVWSVVFSDLVHHSTADTALLCIKAVAQGLVGIFLTGILERFIVAWVVHTQDFPNSGALHILYKARSTPEWRYTYPIIVPIFLNDITIVYLITALFLLFKGNIKKDTVLWLALLSQVMLTCLHFWLRRLHYLRLTLIFGPPVWDVIQLVLPGLTAAGWEQWRLYNIRLLLTGKKCDVSRFSYKKGALDFCI